MSEIFGTTSTGETVQRMEISAGELTASVLSHGAVLQDVRLAGVGHSLTVGSPDIAAYEGKMASCGSVMGPVVNRIAGGAAELDGAQLTFDRNFRDLHTVHSGAAAIHKRPWQVETEAADHVVLRIEMPDGDGGFPGNRVVRARFEILPPATLRLTLTAETDRPTLLNLANHSYWRLDPAPTVAGHVLQVAADRYTPLGDDVALLPTGEVASVEGTACDFRQGRVLDDGRSGLIDNNLCLSDGREALRPVAWLTGTSGLRMEMATTEPGLQVFDGHQLDLPQFENNDGGSPVPYCGVALEAQFWPDAPHHPNFPSIVLRPGEAWEQVTEWRFLRG